MDRLLKIGTRASKLAIWQANLVHRLLLENGQPAELAFIKSAGDFDQNTPLYAAGIYGIFTKALDIALLRREIDLAVHSYKDVPTELAKGLKVAAVLERGSPFDVLVCRNEAVLAEISPDKPSIVATCSVRRKAQWLHRYKKAQMRDIRGNVDSRIEKLRASDWHGAIFAQAGLQRLQLQEAFTGPQVLLDWMLPAPAQGAIVVVCREGEEGIFQICQKLNHENTSICTSAERAFLSLMQGGCTVPVSAYATIEGGAIQLITNITAPDGSDSITLTMAENLGQYSIIAQKAAAEMMDKGGKGLISRKQAK